MVDTQVLSSLPLFASLDDAIEEATRQRLAADAG